MLRAFIIYLSKAGWARRLVMGLGFARRTALRFVAGETLESAIEVVKQLNDQGMLATVDHLGEDTHTQAEANRYTEDILAVLSAIEDSGVVSNVSIKLTQIGLTIDKEMCERNLARILEHARALGNFVRIDLEDFPVLDDTVQLYLRMRKTRGFDNVGMVIQSYLRRGEEITRELLSEGTAFRLVKGAYNEPPEVAFQKKFETDANFDRLTEILLAASQEDGTSSLNQDGKWPPVAAIATHDEKRIEHAKLYARQINLPKEKMEFQFLHGIRRELHRALVAQSYPVRIYVPYGTEWYPYFMRRLAERPANLWFFVSNLLRK